jgi:perosamine synthetase
MAEKLALLGGPKAVSKEFPRFNHIGREELETAAKVLESGILSQFVGAWDADFYGGPMVQQFEKKWSDFFKVKKTVSVNSATSGLIVALGAIGLEPGDEVIVSPWTMCASATAILIWNAIPVFADIEPETYNLDPKCVEKAITSRTKAIVVPDIFGHPAQLDELMALAKKHGLRVIEDCAQSPGAMYKGRPAGTISDIGIFSLNYHKHIHTGEGGMCVTNDTRLAERMQLIRNHAEGVVGNKGENDLVNMIGFNFRLGEIEAAIGLEQLKKLPNLVKSRQKASEAITAGTSGLKGLRDCLVKPDCTHAYYVLPFGYEPNETGVSRDRIVAALQAEGVPASGGYVNVHLLPMYQKKIAYGSKGFPWTAGFYGGNVSYKKGICPVAEDLHDNKHFNLGMCAYEYTEEQVDMIISAFQKVWGNLEYLRAKA